MKRYIPYEVDFDCKVVGDKETIRVQGVMLEHPEGRYVNFSDVERLIAERDAAVKALKRIKETGVFLGAIAQEMMDDAIDAARGEK